MGVALELDRELALELDREPDPVRPPSRSSFSDELRASLVRLRDAAPSRLSGVVALRLETLIAGDRNTEVSPSTRSSEVVFVGKAGREALDALSRLSADSWASLRDMVRASLVFFLSSELRPDAFESALMLLLSPRPRVGVPAVFGSAGALRLRSSCCLRSCVVKHNLPTRRARAWWPILLRF